MIKKSESLKMFGQIGIEKGYITSEQVEQALEIQKSLNEQGTHKLIGLIMLEYDMITNSQLIDILKYFENPEE